MAIAFQNYLFTDAGAAVSGATVDLLARNTTTPVLDTTTTSAAGLWTFSYGTQGRYDVRITNGTSVRWHKYDAQLQLDTLEVANFRVRNPADTFEYDIVPAAITAARTLNLPLITATRTLVANDTALADNESIIFGTGADASILYDGTNLVINPQLVGSGVLDLAAGILELNNAVRFDTGVAVVSTAYSVGRDADATNQLHYNVPTGATYEWSVNDVAQMTLSTTTLNLVPGQIAFPASQNASAGANTLDDYEEGTWTPGLTFGGGSTGMTFAATRNGVYTKIGRMVQVTAYFVLTAKGSSTGDAVITGLPFTIANTVGNYGAISLRLNTVTFANYPQGYGDANATTLTLDEITDAGVRTTLTDADFANTSEVILRFTYSV